jgi:hypothetical protein
MSEDWSLQASFKVGADMINVRAADIDEFETKLLAFEERAIGTVVSIQQKIDAARNVGASIPVATATPPVSATTETVKEQQTWGTPTTTSQTISRPSCQHGQRVGREGNGAKGPWRAYFCPTPKGTPDQCDPMWVDRKDDSAWNSWVAG